MSRLTLAPLAVLALASATRAQGPSTTQVALQLRLVSQIGSPGSPSGVRSFDTTSHPDTTSPLGVPRRFEVQYRLVDLDVSDDFNPAGLVSCTLRIAVTGATIQRAALSQFEAGSPAPGAPPISQPVNLLTDQSPLAANGAAGLHRPFRAGIPAPEPNNSDPANGILENGDTVLRASPLAAARTDQYAPADPGGGWYGVYSFNAVPVNCTYAVFVSLDPDSATGNRFSFFNDGDPASVAGTAAFGDNATSLCPAPASTSALLLACICAPTRRRRCT